MAMSVAQITSLKAHPGATAVEGSISSPRPLTSNGPGSDEYRLNACSRSVLGAGKRLFPEEVKRAGHAFTA